MGVGRMLIILGGILLIAGIALTLGERFGLGRLPGDIVYRGKNTTFYFPIATSIILSVILSLAFWLMSRR